MTAEFTQGYPDWGRMVAANAEPFVNDVSVNHSNNDLFGPFPIGGWQSIFARWSSQVVDTRLEFKMSATTTEAQAFTTDSYWTRATFSRRMWVPLVGQFLFVRLFQGVVTPNDPTTVTIVPVPYLAHRNRIRAEDALLSGDASIAAAAAHNNESIEVYCGPALFTFSTTATAFTLNLFWRNFAGTLTGFFSAGNTFLYRPTLPVLLYVPDGRVRLEFINNDASARTIRYALVPQKPAVGSA